MKTTGRQATADKQGTVDLLAKLQEILEAVDGLEMSVDNIDISTANIDINTDELEARIGEISATPTANTVQDRLRLILAELTSILTAFTAEDFASETTLSSLKTVADTINTVLDSLDAKDFSTETTLAAIKAQTDKLTFVVDKLKVDASFTGDSKFGDSAAKSVVAVSVTTVQLKAANTGRKEIIITNTSNKTLWVAYGVAAVLNEGIPIEKNDILIEDIFRGAINGIWDTGATGNAIIQEVTT